MVVKRIGKITKFIGPNGMIVYVDDVMDQRKVSLPTVDSIVNAMFDMCNPIAGDIREFRFEFDTQEEKDDFDNMISPLLFVNSKEE